MMRRVLRRRSNIRYLLFICVIFPLIDLFLCAQSSYPSNTSQPSAEDLQHTRSVYIASTHWNTATALEEHWIENFIQTIKELKKANIRVFVAIYENGSWDSTKKILMGLRTTLQSLGIENSIVLDDQSHESVIARNDSSMGWLRTKYGTEMRRIPYLASVRNEALKPLERFTADGTRFDKLLYFNDVVFSVRWIPLLHCSEL